MPLFTTNRKQYLLLSHTTTLYSCIMHGSGLTNVKKFGERAVSTIRELMEANFDPDVFEKLILLAAGEFHFAKAFKRLMAG